MREELVNSSQNCFTLFLAKLIHQPLHRIAGVLALIAAVRTIAKGDDIGGNHAGAILARVGQPVIHSKPMKQPRGTPTNGATTFEVIEGKLPIALCVIDSMTSLTRKVETHIQSGFIWIVNTPSLHLLAAIGVFLLGNSVFLALCIKVAGAPFSARFAPLITILCSVSSISYSALVRVSLLLRENASAWLTGGAQCIGAIITGGIEVFQRGRKDFIAARTLADGGIIACFTLFQGSAQNSSSGVGASLTAIDKAIGLGSVGSKVFSRRGIVFIAGWAMLGWGRVWGIIGHVNRSLLAVGRTGDASTSPGISIGLTGVIVPQMEGLG